MTTYFRAMSPKIWWIVDVGFSHALDDDAPTNAQEKCLHLDVQATNVLFSALSVDVFYKVCNLKSVHDMWIELQRLYEESTTSVDCIEDSIIVDDCSTSSSNDLDNFSISSSSDEDSISYTHIGKLTKLSSSLRCLMAKGNTKVNLDDDDYEYTYDELVEMLEGMNERINKCKSKMKV